MPELESEVVNPFKCQALIDLSVDYAGDGVGDQGSIVEAILVCPMECQLKFRLETKFVRDSSNVEEAIRELKSLIARQIDIRCVPLKTARTTGNSDKFVPPDGLS